MRKFLTIILITSCQTLFGQCPTTGISTNPDNPVNNQNPNYVNDFFDWRNNTFPVNSNNVNATQIISPYSPNGNLNSNTIDLSITKDYLPEDGWELIAWDMGFDEDMNLDNPPAGNVHFILYNKYTSILRIFVAGKDNNAYNSARISINIISESINFNDIAQPSLLQDPNNISGLDKHYSEPLISTSNFLNGLVSNWFYADFFINYDPCVCFYESTINFNVQFVSNSTINISGDFNGQITQVDNGLGTTNNGYSFKTKDLIEGGQKAYKKYETLQKFIDDQEKADGIFQKPENLLTAEEKKKKESFSRLNEFIASTDGLTSILKVVPYVGSALELVKFFVSKTKSTQQSTPTPFAINAELNLKGNIVTVNDYINPRYYTPGSKNSNQSNNQYPYYNEVLGFFNLLETPKVKYYYLNTVNYASIVLDNNINNLHIRNVDRIRQIEKFELINEELKYVINPAAGIQEENIHIFASISYESNYVDMTNSPFVIKDKMIETELFPISCLFDSKFEFERTIDFKHDIINNQFVQNSIQFDIINQTQTGVEIPIDFTYAQYLNPELEALKNYTRKFKNLSLKVFVFFQLPNGSNAMQTFAYPLEIENNSPLSFDKNTPPQNYQTSLFLENIELDKNYSAFNILIGNNVTVKPNTTVILTAGNEITVLPEAVILPEIILQVEPAPGCFSFPKTLQQDPLSVSQFCNSMSYKDLRNKNSSLFINNNQMNEFDKYKNPFTFSLYPNPTSGQVTVRFNQAFEGASISVTDVFGKEMQVRTQKTDQGFELSLEEFAVGVYLVTVHTPEGSITKQLVKK